MSQRKVKKVRIIDVTSSVANRVKEFVHKADSCKNITWVLREVRNLDGVLVGPYVAQCKLGGMCKYKSCPNLEEVLSH